jgi:hypothetical protein
MNMAEDRVGPERIKSSYAWRTIINEGGIIANGSDAPVELVNPYHGLYAAVTRQDRITGQPPGGWYPEQALTRQEALRSFTIWGAYAAFSEDNRGSLEAGKYADFVMLDRDYMNCPASQIKDITALATVIGGELVYGTFATSGGTPLPGGAGGTGSTTSAQPDQADQPDAVSPIMPVGGQDVSTGIGVVGPLTSFTDGAKVSSWAQTYFERLITGGVISGRADGSLDPAGDVSRAEFTKMIVLALNLNATGTPKVFSEDVAEGSWYKPFVDAASSNGLIGGVSDSSFAPNNNITREDLCVIMYRALLLKNAALPENVYAAFTDSTNISEYAVDAVAMLKQINIISGRLDGSFDPKAFATREEAAKIICGIIDYVGSLSVK